MENTRIILGIDPGTVYTGYGIISITNNRLTLDNFGWLDLTKINDPYEKLSKIFSKTIYLIQTYKPGELAVEAPFFGKNVQSMLKLGRAQGVVIAAAMSENLKIFEYSPREIKQSVTGNGAASKEQVALFLKNILKFNDMPEKLDATDGLAAAVCHYFQNSKSVQTKKNSSWKDFINKNPDRVK